MNKGRKHRMVEKQAQLDNMKRELDVINKICSVLSYGQFSGALAQDVAISQMYLQGLAKHMKGEYEKLEHSIKAVEPTNTVTVVDQTPVVEVIK